MKRIVKNIKYKRNILLGFQVLVVMVLFTAPSFADSVDPTVGFQKAVDEILKWLLIVIPSFAGLYTTFHLVKKGMSEDQAVRNECNIKIKNTLISSGLALGASAVTKFLLGFFK